MTTILWIANELSALERRVLDQVSQYKPQCKIVVQSPAAAPRAVSDRVGAAVVLSVPVSELFESELLDRVQKLDPALPIVVYCPGAGFSESGQLIRQGVCHCILDELQPEPLLRVLEGAVEYGRTLQLGRLTTRIVEEPWRRALIGESREMEQVSDLIRLIGPRRSTVLITGETGTGKEVVAGAIHRAGSRAERPMVAVNCNALPESLLETELFGHTKGAFTGALYPRAGRFEQAHHSTIFLDEIGDLPLEIQCKLLRVLQEREIQRVGSAETIQIDVRVIAATNVELAEAVQARRFREDLFYRLKVVPIHLPPLRQRAGDIPLLVQFFLEKLCRKEDIAAKVVTAEAIERLCAYNWPGNVRQLEHTVEMAIVLSGDRRLLYPDDFQLPAIAVVPDRSERARLLEIPEEGIDFEAMMHHIQRSLVQEALQKAGGNKARAAQMLGMKRSTLVSKVKALG